MLLVHGPAAGRTCLLPGCQTCRHVRWGVVALPRRGSRSRYARWRSLVDHRGCLVSTRSLALTTRPADQSSAALVQRIAVVADLGAVGHAVVVGVLLPRVGPVLRDLPAVGQAVAVGVLL